MICLHSTTFHHENTESEQSPGPRNTARQRDEHFSPHLHTSSEINNSNFIKKWVLANTFPLIRLLIWHALTRLISFLAADARKHRPADRSIICWYLLALGEPAADTGLGQDERVSLLTRRLCFRDRPVCVRQLARRWDPFVAVDICYNWLILFIQFGFSMEIVSPRPRLQSGTRNVFLEPKSYAWSTKDVFCTVMWPWAR